MFKIEELILYSTEQEEYSYTFSTGINYYRGENDKGKTEFYNFLDYMLGSSKSLDLSKAWFKKLEKASLKININGIHYIFTRTKEREHNFFRYADSKEPEEKIPYRIYKDRMNSLLGANKEDSSNIKEFTGEDYSYRVFTMFNFLGETGQGITNDFFDKCSDIEYKIKLPSLLDLIFNKNLPEILSLEKELDTLLAEIKKLEKNEFKSEYINEQINNNINILGLNITYNGYNKDKVLEKLDEAKNLHSIQKKNLGDIVELEYLYNHINEQIKVYDTSSINLKQMQLADKNRENLLKNLKSIISDNPEFSYLVNPLEDLIKDVDNSASITNYLITDKTISELIKKRTVLKKEIEKYKHYSTLYNLNEKEKACALLENYLNEDTVTFSMEQLKEKRTRVSEIRKTLKELKKFQDKKKIDYLSQQITDIYKQAKSSSLVKDDLSVEGFKITYIKSGNILQPQKNQTIKDKNNEDKIIDVNYSLGSMARQTLIQLSGYIGFLNMLLNENKYPIIPILVIDHVSKPFDVNNKKGIGEILNYALSLIGKENIQIFLFDDKDYNDIGLIPNQAEDLVNKEKTGFIPFYIPPQNEDREPKDRMDTKE
ncbi:MAG: hypothetical protein ACI4S3_02955 [Candidatus Gastranaerophilaceae bacterium]